VDLIVQDISALMGQTESLAGCFRARQFDDREALSWHAAGLIEQEIQGRPNLLLCTAAGSTPERTYLLLAEKKLTKAHLFDQLRIIKLDEWGGLPSDHEATCESYLQRLLIRPLGIPDDRYIAFGGDSHDPQAECERIRRALSQHSPIDLCVLGLGANGHLGLNEPAEALTPFAHVAKLAESSLKHPMLGSASGQVRYGLTLGMAEIMQSRKVLLLVSGAHKRQPLRRLLKLEISSRFPASFLWLHPDVTLLYDQSSAQGSSGETEAWS